MNYFSLTFSFADFFAVDVSEGRLRVFLNYGSGTFVASPQSPVADGRRHHVDVLWSPQVRTVWSPQVRTVVRTRR